MARDQLSWGKIGCLSVIAVPLIFIGIIFIMARISPGSGEMTERVLMHELPPSGSAGVGSSSPGQITLSVRGAELYLRAASADEPITVEAVYNGDAATLTEAFDPKPTGEWSYTLTFEGIDESLVGYLSSLFRSESPRLTVSIPRRASHALDLKIMQGGALVDLGGLALTTADVSVLQGGLNMDVSEPVEQAMERFSLTGSMGGITVSSLGNASPETLEVKQRMGGLSLDLDGAWQGDARVAVVVEMGGAAVFVPDNVAVRILNDQDSESPEDATPGEPVLTLTTKAEMGEIELIR